MDEEITHDHEQRTRHFAELNEAGRRIKETIATSIGYDTELPLPAGGTGVLKITTVGVNNCLKKNTHSRTVECKEAFLHALRNPQILNYRNSKELGEGKNMENPEDRRNVERKRRRGVIKYHYYNFSIGRKNYILGLEELQDGFEQPYFIARIGRRRRSEE